MYRPTGPREAQLLETVNTLLDARRTHQPLDDLPALLQPATLDEVYWVQDQMATSYMGTHEFPGGWKIGGKADEIPLFAPMPQAWTAPSGTMLAPQAHRYRAVEAEIAYLLGDDLPPRATPYTDEEVYAAVASAHAAIEVLESAFTDPLCAARNSMLADLQRHGAFIYGPACDGWRTVDLTKERVTLTVDGSVRVEREGGEGALELRRLLPWLANEGAYRTGGLHAGQWITTGSWTGDTLALSGSVAEVHFSTLGRVAVQLS